MKSSYTQIRLFSEFHKKNNQSEKKKKKLPGALMGTCGGRTTLESIS